MPSGNFAAGFTTREKGTRTMTRERAKYILSSRMMGGDLRYAFRPTSYTGRLFNDGMTKSEHAAVRALWLTLPGSASFHSTLCEVATGRLAAKELINDQA